jgi:hypothetical protein
MGAHGVSQATQQQEVSVTWQLVIVTLVAGFVDDFSYAACKLN